VSLYTNPGPKPAGTCQWLLACRQPAVAVVHSAVGTHPVCDDCRSSMVRIYARANARLATRAAL